MELRTLVTFRSQRFNTSESKPHYIDPYSFDDDVAEWMVRPLKENGVRVDKKIGQEDFGWYLGFRSGPHKYNFVMGYNADGYWLGWLERRRGVIGSVLGVRKRGVHPDAAAMIHLILSSSKDVSNIRWHFPKDFDALRENLGTAMPLG